jgi:hypothetical protein
VKGGVEAAKASNSGAEVIKGGASLVKGGVEAAKASKEVAQGTKATKNVVKAEQAAQRAEGVEAGVAQAAKVEQADVLGERVVRGEVGLSSSLRKSVQKTIKPGGKIIGKQLGNNPKIRTITTSDANQVIQKLIKSGAQKVENPRYPGTWYQFPNGKGFGVRITNSVASLEHGTKNCIDLKNLGVHDIEKLKF